MKRLVAVALLAALIGLLGSAATRAAAQRPADAARALEVQRALYTDPRLIRVDVETLMGVLYLRGTAPDPDSIARAERLSAGVGGIEEVRNRIHQNDAADPRVPDLELAVRVRAALAGGPGRGLGIDTQGGRVALMGELANASQALAVIESVRAVEGVRALGLEQLRVGSRAP